jgi:hypothetical protein
VSDAKKIILFEPWNMGDALIAAAIALQDPTRLALACNPRWHPLIRAVTEGNTAPELIAADLGYVNRARTDRWDFGSLSAISPSSTTVATIRGDIRDYLAAKKLFPKASIRSSGWFAFTARRSPLLNLPYAKGWLPVRNRYRAWASIASIPWEKLKGFYEQRLPEPAAQLISIHIGAQWRSRQYPHVAKLSELLAETCPVQILAGPGDTLPSGIAETDVCRLVDRELVDALRVSSHVIVNDSGPMHLAALLHCRTHPIARMSAINEWLPPAITPIKAADMPQGYRPHRSYMSDSVANGWPPPEEIVQLLQLS